HSSNCITSQCISSIFLLLVVLFLCKLSSSAFSFLIFFFLTVFRLLIHHTLVTTLLSSSWIPQCIGHLHFHWQCTFDTPNRVLQEPPIISRRRRHLRREPSSLQVSDH
ncbi:hypothetical protein VIGAN_03270700, partial [Vigna angularis var. angularis]